MIVILCEKRDQANKVAEGLEFKRVGKTYRGLLNNKSAVITWAAGHLVSLIEPQEAKAGLSWNDPATLLPLPDRPRLAVIQRSGRGPKPSEYLDNIKALLATSSDVWIATDPDREGEGIGRNILAFLKYNGAIHRVWLADSLEPADVKAAFSNLKTGESTEPLWRAQQAREYADWLWQFMVRNFTYYGRCKTMGDHLGLGKGAHGVVSVGRVQTPTLRLIVERDEAIKNFKSTDHFVISGKFSGDVDLPYKPLISEEQVGVPRPGVVWVDNKPLYTDKNAVDGFRSRLIGAGNGRVADCKKKPATKNPPTPFSLTQLQRYMSKVHKLTAAKTQKAAESLYLAGLISYPRTEHGELPMALYEPKTIGQLLNNCAGFTPFERQALYLSKLHASCEGTAPACFTRNAMEHHGIIPTAKRPDFTADLDANAEKVWLAVAQQFLQALYPPAKLTQLDLTVTVGTEDLLANAESRFHAVFKHIDEPGWMAAFDALTVSAPLPTLKAGSDIPIDNIVVKPTKTKPPKHYTEDTLLSAMINAGRELEDENLAKVLKSCKGIGTPATRSTIIETLITREYITRSKGYLLSQPKGVDLIQFTPNRLSDVSLTAAWEHALADIANAPNDAAAVRRRDSFTLEQKQFVSEIIYSSTEQYQTAVSSSTQMAKPGNPPSEKMRALAKKIASDKHIDLPAGALDSFIICRKFLNDHPSPPTDKMVKTARSIAKQKNIDLNEEVLTSFSKCKEFLGEHLSS